MKTTTAVIIFTLICLGSVHSQSDIRSKIRVADSSTVQIITTKDGSTLNGRVTEVGENEIKFETNIGTVQIPIDKIKDIKEISNKSMRNGEYWFPNQSEAVLDQKGRVKLIVASTAAGLGYYGWAIPIALHMKSGKAIASTYMFTGALSFFIPYRTTINSSVTESAANAYVYGTTRGALHGYILNSLVYGNDFSPRRAFGFSVAGSVGEAVGFYKLTSAQNWSAGKVELLGVGGDFGFGIGVAAPFALNYENKNRVYAASMLIGTGTGFVAANYLSGKDHYSQGDAFVIRGAGMMGSYVSLSAMNLIQPKNERWYAGIFIAGSLSGLYLGNRLVDEKDFTPAQGTFIEIGQLAGWLTGLGIAYLIQDPAKSDNSRLFMTMSAIGGMSGYTLMYRSFADKAQKKAAKSSWNLRLTPQNLLLAKFYRSNTGFGIPMPVAALDVTF